MKKHKLKIEFYFLLYFIMIIIIIMTTTFVALNKNSDHKEL